MIKKITILAMLFMFVGAVSAQEKTAPKKECAKTEKCTQKCNKSEKCNKECDKQCKNKSAKAEKGNCSKSCEKSSTAKK